VFLEKKQYRNNSDIVDYSMYVHLPVANSELGSSVGMNAAEISTGEEVQ